MLLKYFRDPKDENELKEVHDKISNISSPEEAYEFAKSIDGWIVDEIVGFAPGLEKIEENWSKLCEMFKQKKKTILIVKKIILERAPAFTTITAISEILTRCGWCVRGANDFKRCNGCNLAIQSYLDKTGKDFCESCDLDQMIKKE